MVLGYKWIASAGYPEVLTGLEGQQPSRYIMDKSP